MAGGIDRRGLIGAAAALALAPTAASAAGAGGTETAVRKPRKAGPSAADGGVSGVVAAHVVGASFADFDAKTVAQAKLRVLDLIGCAIGSTRGEGNAALARVVAAGAGKPEATILGLGTKTSAREAAMANAILARSYDFEVMTVLARDLQVPSHHSPTTVMTALASLVSRVKVEGWPPGTRGVVIEVTTRDGRVLREALPGKPKHYPDVAGSTPKEVEAKFRQQVAFAGNVPAGLADQIVHRVDALDRENDMAGFANLVSRATRFPKV